MRSAEKFEFWLLGVDGVDDDDADEEVGEEGEGSDSDDTAVVRYEGKVWIIALLQASRSVVLALEKVWRLVRNCLAPSSEKLGTRQRRETAMAEDAITLGRT